MASLPAILLAGEPAAPSAPSESMAVCTVEIAFNAGWATPAAQQTWTDVSQYVELSDLITISWGRGDERSDADPNQLTLTLDNSDGRFTFGKTDGAYYPAVRLNRPIRVRLDPVDGSEEVYFLGFINVWPTEWDGTDAYAKATISASSRLSRSGTQASLKSIIESTILADSPVAYYTLGESEGATQANDSSGNKADPLVLQGDPTLPIVFGSATGPGTDGLTAAQFNSDPAVPAAGQYLHSPATSASFAGVSIEACFLADATPVPDARLAFLNVAGSNLELGLGQVNGKLTASGPSGSGILSANNMCDGATHHACATWDGTTLVLYLDGSSVGTLAEAGTPKMGTLEVGENLAGLEAHVAVFGAALTAPQVAAHASASLAGFAGETTSARLTRYAALAGIAATEVSAETGSTTVQHIDTTDKQVVELMRVMETTEAGVLYDERDGTLTFHNRAHRYTTASAYTLNMAEGEVEAGYAPRVDLTGLANDITASDVSGRYTAHVLDDESIDDNGVATKSIETASEDDGEPLNLASWNLYQFKDPAERVPNLEVDALAQVGKTPNCSTVLATTVGTKITVSNRPTQSSSSTIDYFVEGGTAVIGHESVRLTFNVSPSAPYDQVLVIDDATRGVIDTNVIGL